jgi:hypothetical protein
MYYAIYQHGGPIYGVGETPEAALDDAGEMLAQENCAIIAVPPMANSDNELRDGRFYLATISTKDANEVRVNFSCDTVYEIYSSAPRYARGVAFFKYRLELTR